MKNLLIYITYKFPDAPNIPQQIIFKNNVIDNILFALNF